MTWRKESTRSREINPCSRKCPVQSASGASGMGSRFPLPIWITGSGQRSDKKQVERQIKEHNGICISSNANVQIGPIGIHGSRSNQCEKNPLSWKACTLQELQSSLKCCFLHVCTGYYVFFLIFHLQWSNFALIIIQTISSRTSRFSPLFAAVWVLASC